MKMWKIIVEHKNSDDDVSNHKEPQAGPSKKKDIHSYKRKSYFEITESKTVSSSAKVVF